MDAGAGMAITGRSDTPRGGFGVALNLAGTVRRPFFSRKPDGTKAMSCTLECGELFAVHEVDGRDRYETVHVLDGDIAFLDQQAGYLDRARAAFYTEACLQSSGFFLDGIPTAEALVQIALARAMYNPTSLVFPFWLRVVGYGELAYQFAEMAHDGTEVAVTGYGRTWRPRRGKHARRFEVVATYVHFLRQVDWPDGGPDRFLPRTAAGFPNRLAPSANIVGLVVEPPRFTAAQNGRSDFLNLVVSAGWRPGLDALVVLYAFGAQACALAEQVQWYDLIQANCMVLLKRNKGLPLVRFAIRDLAVLGHREAW